MKRRLRQGAKLIVIDPRETETVRGPHYRADYHLQLKPGTNVAVITALAHVVVTEGLLAADYIAERCDDKSFQQWKDFVARPENSPEAVAAVCGVPAAQLRGAARLYAQPGNSAIYYGLGVTEHAQGSTMVMGIANLAMATGNVGREGVGVNPLRGQNNVQGACDMGSFPHELPGYRHISDSTVRAQFEGAVRGFFTGGGTDIAAGVDKCLDELLAQREVLLLGAADRGRQGLARVGAVEQRAEPPKCREHRAGISAAPAPT